MESDESMDFRLNLFQAFFGVGDFDPAGVGEVDPDTEWRESRSSFEQIFGVTFVFPPEKVKLPLDIFAVELRKRFRFNAAEIIGINRPALMMNLNARAIRLNPIAAFLDPSLSTDASKNTHCPEGSFSQKMAKGASLGSEASCLYAR